MKINQLLKPLLVLALAFPALFSFSQSPTCGFDKLHNDLLDRNSAFRKTVNGGETRIQERTSLGAKTLATVYKIPVVVHVIHLGEALGSGSNISDAQIQSAISSMTQHYRGTLGNSVDAEIEFELAQLDPNCNTTNGIVRVNGSGVFNYAANGLVTSGPGANEQAVKDLSRWPNNRYYNIWIVSEIDSNNAGAGIQGFAYFPGAPSNIDGAVMLYNAFGYDPTMLLGYNLKSYTNRNTTATHEMGHALGLYHTFQGDDANNDGVPDTCPANTDCSAQGDRVCDTDPHRRSASNCPVGINVCTGSPLGTIVNNYMDYSSETCQDRFTTGQVARMRAALEQLRPELITSVAGSPYPYGTFASPVAASCTPVTDPIFGGDPDNFFAGLMRVSVGDVDFEWTNSPGLDGGYLDKANCHNEVMLFTGSTYNFSAVVWGANQEQVRAWIDYNNDGMFDNVTEQIFYANNLPSSPTDFIMTSGSFTVPGSAVTNTPLRLRVLNEVGTIYGGSFAINNACYNPLYGQAEDYLVRIGSVLPVTLIGFDGQLQGRQVLLQWSTSQEHQSKLFEVQRSLNGTEFHTIGYVNAAGSSNELRKYSFIDTRPGVVNYYRLKMVDIDGKERFSSIVLIKNPDAAQDMWVFGNPLGQQIQLRFVRKAEQLKLQLLNSTGALVEEKIINNAGEVVNWNVSAHLASGVYIIRAISDGEVFTQKLVK